MKLTNEQRLVIYKKLLKLVCKDPDVEMGMCYYIHGELIMLLRRADNIPSWWNNERNKISFLTELYRHRPKTPKEYSGFVGYWAPPTKEGWETRISWIEKAIEQVQNKIKNHEN